MMIAIPSKGRAGRICRALELLPTAHVCVPELEADAYRGIGVREVVAVPDSVQGITATRNFIIETAEERGETRLLFVDDDPIDCGYWILGSETGHKARLSPEQWRSEFVRLFEVLEGLGLRAFGLHTQSAKRSVYPYHPFRFRSYLTASCLGLRLGTGLRFDETFPVKEDYELCLRLLEEDGAILSVQYLYWENAHLTTSGGCSAYRTPEIEEDAIARLIDRYPGQVRRAPKARNPFGIELRV